jgi:hypothetical protein
MIQFDTPLAYLDLFPPTGIITLSKVLNTFKYDAVTSAVRCEIALATQEKEACPRLLNTPKQKELDGFITITSASQ